MKYEDLKTIAAARCIAIYEDFTNIEITRACKSVKSAWEIGKEILDGDYIQNPPEAVLASRHENPDPDYRCTCANSTGNAGRQLWDKE